MKLNDREILELNQLCGAVVDGTLTSAQRDRLQSWLRESEAVRRYYVRAVGQSASLHSYAAEIHADAPDARPRPGPSRVVYWLGGALALAAAVVFGAWILPSRKSPAQPSESPVTMVARITGTNDAQRDDGKVLQPGQLVRVGERVDLAAGAAEITFDSGARVVLSGKASLVVNSAWDATLRRGSLRATVPPEAIGFRVLNRAVEVVDLGTEFTMTTDGNGVAEVLVLKGEVEAAPRAAAEQDTILLREKEARRFEATGVSPIPDSERKFAEAKHEPVLQRAVPTLSYVHYSFDEDKGPVAPARDGGLNAEALVGTPSVNLQLVRSEGRHGRALRFDGDLQVSGAVPGLSGVTPHTIAFWVRVAEDAPLSDAYAMVAWATQLPQLGSRPVQISWNRRPGEGPLGALRTDFGGGCAIARTSLRDGKWHHVAILFSPGDGAVPVQVKQYVDGRLESSTIIPGRIRAPAGTGDAARKDVLWLGCRLTGHTKRDHFRGELDELFIANVALEPEEIVALARDNRIEPGRLFAAASPAK